MFLCNDVWWWLLFSPLVLAECFILIAWHCSTTPVKALIVVSWSMMPLQHHMLQPFGTCFQNLLNGTEEVWESKGRTEGVWVGASVRICTDCVNSDRVLWVAGVLEINCMNILCFCNWGFNEIWILLKNWRITNEKQSYIPWKPIVFCCRRYLSKVRFLPAPILWSAGDLIGF